MPHRKIIEDYYSDVCNLTDTLSKLVNSYRLLIGGAEELNGIGLAHKNQIKAAIDRAVELGHIIDDVIDTLDKSQGAYLKYCMLKDEFLDSKIHAAYILTEINDELQFQEDKK